MSPPEYDTVSSEISSPAYKGDAARTLYQKTLNASSMRTDIDFAVILRDDELWVDADYRTGSCNREPCGTIVRQADNKLVVSLPVGYTRQTNVTPEPTNLLPVDKLVFWNPETHCQETAVPSTNMGTSGATQLPYVLADKPADTLRKGETAYVYASYVRATPDGRFFLQPTADVRTEPLGAQFGGSSDALIVRRGDNKGLEVQLPKGFKPLVADVDSWIPVTVTHASTSPVVRDAGAHPTHLVSPCHFYCIIACSYENSRNRK